MRQMDLTQGDIGKTLLRYAAPVVLSSLLQSAYAITDLVVAGHLVGEAAISAINNGSQIILLLTQIIIGITMGGNVLISQYYGSGDRENRVQTNRSLLMLSLLSGVVMTVMVLLLGRRLLLLLHAPALEEATLYLCICALGLLPVFGYNALSAMIRGVGNSKQPLYFVLATAVANVVLDVLFVLGFEWGVAGVAWATVIAQTASFFLALAYVIRQRGMYDLALQQLRIHGDKLRMMLKLGIPSAVQMSLVGLSWLTMTFLINRYGVEASAASGIAMKIKDCCQLFITAVTSATATMVAQCLGAGAFDRAKRTIHIAMGITVGVSLGIILVVELLAPVLVSLFSPDALTARYAVQNLRIEIVAQVFYAVFMVHNALALGAGHPLFVLGNSIMNSIFVRLILAAVFNHYFGLVGIFWACMIAPASSVPLGYLYERSNLWRKSLVKGHRVPSPEGKHWI